MPMPPTMPLYFTFVKSNIVPDAACLHLSKRIHSKRTEHGSLKVSAPAWSHTYRPAASHERLRQARRLWGDDSLYWQCGPAAGPTRLGDCRCLRDRRCSVVNTCFFYEDRCDRTCSISLGSGGLII